MKQILIAFLLLFCSPVHAENVNRTEVLSYFYQLAYIEVWGGETSKAFLDKSKTLKEGAQPDFFFSGVVTIQQKVLSLLQALPAPNAEDIKSYHNQRIQAVKTLVDAFNAGLNHNEDEYKDLQIKAKEMLKSTDELVEQLKSKYNITEEEIRALADSKKVDVQWMESTIKAKP